VSEWTTIVAAIVLGQAGLWAAVAGAADTNLPEGAISYWTFDDGMAKDVIGSNDRTVYGAVSATGKVMLRIGSRQKTRRANPTG